MSAVFVYGTLLQGQSRGSRILAASPRRIIPARTPGRLVDLGDYPGLILARTNDHWVFGEYAEFEDAEFQKVNALLTELDSIEQYMPNAEATSLYVRRSVPVVLEDGTESWAYAYLYNQPCDPCAVIRSGDWRQRGK